MQSLRVVHYRELTEDDERALFDRRQGLDEIMISVRSIMRRVEQEGDAALFRYTREFDGVKLTELEVPADEVARAREAIEPHVLAALEELLRAVRSFHAAQAPVPEHVETSPGVRAWREWRPIERVGLYVPGGRAPLASSVVMLGIPAIIAGCKEIIL